MEQSLAQCQRDLANMEANAMTALAGDVGRRAALLRLIAAARRRVDGLMREEDLADAAYCLTALKRVRTYMGQRIGVTLRPMRGSLHEPPTTYRAGEVVLFRPASQAGYVIIETALTRIEVDALLAKRARFFTVRHLAGVWEGDVAAIEGQ